MIERGLLPDSWNLHRTKNSLFAESFPDTRHVTLSFSLNFSHNEKLLSLLFSFPSLFSFFFPLLFPESNNGETFVFLQRRMSEKIRPSLGPVEPQFLFLTNHPASSQVNGRRTEPSSAQTFIGCRVLNSCFPFLGGAYYSSLYLSSFKNNLKILKVIFLVTLTISQFPHPSLVQILQ